MALLNIIHNDLEEINIYSKCLIIDIFTFNKYHIKLLLAEMNQIKFTTHFFDSLLRVYNYIELNKQFDKIEKYALRNNIHRFINYFIQVDLNNNITAQQTVFKNIDLSEMLFLFGQDMNFFFEYIIQFIKYKNVAISNIAFSNLIPITDKYCLYLKESFHLIQTLLQYDPNIMYTNNFNSTLVSNFNTYINTILNETDKYIYFNFNSSAIYFSWKIDVLEKINNIFCLYKDNELFYKDLLTHGSNFNSKYLKQIEFFLDSINVNSSHTQSDIDILINNINNYNAVSIIDNSLIPDRFLDPILMTVIETPVILPDSELIVDKKMIYSHLLINKTDPFTLLYLDKELLEEYNKKKEVIEKSEHFKKEYEDFIKNKLLELKQNEIVDNAEYINE